MKIKRICEICGKEFFVQPSAAKHGRGKYCSLDCRNISFSRRGKGENNPNWKGGKIERICEICGKSFSIDPNQIKRGGKYCSKKCQSIAHSKKPRGKNHPNWKGGEIERKCGICGESFFIKPSHIKRGWGKYCSKKCQGVAYSTLHKGKNAPNWKGGEVQRKCLACGRVFYTKPSEVKNGNGKYCSIECSVKVQRHNALSKKTRPELIFEDLCIKHNLPFHFVGDGSLWLGNANPDFIHNTRKLCVEVYGDYWHSPLLNGNIRYTHTLEGRRKQLKAEGYKLIVIWESDLKREDAEAFVLCELKKQGIM